MIEALGIPYAAPPIGENRFRPPQPLSGDQGQINATLVGKACPQPGSAADTSEDCLTLNIWAPPRQGCATPLPVFFWIHGGNFQMGSGAHYNASNLAKLGMVVVTINYRLGVLGQMPSDEISLENPSAPGNGAMHFLLDQVAALQWVRRQIAAFGGDPYQITIGGESAGSLSTCLHLHSNVSKGLFRRAIMESGSCQRSPWSDRTTWNSTAARDKAADMMRALNATDLGALRNVPASQLVMPKWFVLPSPDGWVLPTIPMDLPVASDGIDIIIGSNTMDTLMAPPFFDPTTELRSSRDYESLVTKFFGNEVLKFYPAPENKSSKDDIVRAYATIQADVCHTCPKHFLAKKLLAAGDTVYMYHFGFSRNAQLMGLACHGCELPSVFNYTFHLRGTTFFDDVYSAPLGDAMSRYWASFVKYGRPSGSVPWPAYEGTMSQGKFLNISTQSNGKDHLTIDESLRTSECDFFDRFTRTSEAMWQRYSAFCNTPFSWNGSAPDVLV